MSRGATDGARRVVVMPAHAGIQAVSRSWIPADAGMTWPRNLSAHGLACNMYDTL